MTKLEAAARDVVQAARRLDFYARWVPMIEAQESIDKGNTNDFRLAKDFDESVWRLRDAIAEGK